MPMLMAENQMMWMTPDGLIVCRHRMRSASEHELAIIIHQAVVWSEVFADADKVTTEAERLRLLFVV